MNADINASSLNRRSFLKRSSLLTVLGAPSFLNLAFAETPAAYKAIVLINMRGGNDSFNTFVPDTHADYSYQKYLQFRPLNSSLNIPPAKLITLGSSGVAVPEHCRPFVDLYSTGKLSVISNIGQLIEPVTNLTLASAALPRALFSHDDQMAQLANNGSGPNAWAGRAISTEDNNIFNLVSIGGESFVRATGRSNLRLCSSAPNGVRVNWFPYAYEPFSGILNGRCALTDSARKLESYYAKKLASAYAVNQNTHRILAKQSINSSDDLDADFSLAAKVISARNDMGVMRQVVVIDQGGFDTHSNQARDHQPLLQRIAKNVSNLYNWLEKQDLHEKVVILSCSEFGRTLAPNGDGTDHGWGAHHFAVSAGLSDERILGKLPDISTGSADFYRSSTTVSSNGRLIPSTSYDQLLAPLLRWFGCSADTIKSVCPNLANFPAGELNLMKKS